MLYTETNYDMPMQATEDRNNNGSDSTSLNFDDCSFKGLSIIDIFKMDGNNPYTAKILTEYEQAIRYKLREIDANGKNTVQEEVGLKYKGCTIQKRKNCDSYYTRKRVAGKQFTITGSTQLECLENLKEFCSAKNIANIENEMAGIEDESQMTFAMWYDKWFKTYKEDKVKYNTIRDYRSLYRNLSEKFLNMRLKNIMPMHIEDELNSVNAPRQKQKLFAFLKMILEKANINGLVDKNQVEVVDRPSHEKQNGIALSEQDQIILKEICNDINNAEIVVLSMLIGTRRGETLGLCRDALDFENREIKIMKNRAWTHRDKWGPLKNKFAEREIPMFDEAYDILIKYKDLPMDSRIYNFSSSTMDRIMERINKDSRLTRHFHLHEARTTFITNAQNNRIPLHIIQAWVGHEQGSLVTAQTYTTRPTKQVQIPYIKEMSEIQKKIINE